MVKIPHLNIRGVIKSSDEEKYKIQLSENSKAFLETTEIEILTPNAVLELAEGDDVFIKFIDISICENILEFNEIEIYKYIENINKANQRRTIWWTGNDYGGILRSSGESFKYNGNMYVESDIDYSSDGKKYFIDIYDKQLLIEEYKNIFPPMKWYNMVNPQETHFNEIVDVYIKKGRSRR